MTRIGVARPRVALMPETLPPAIGQLYDPTRPGLPEGQSWRLSTRGVELLLSWPRPSPGEIDAVHGLTGEAQFALIEQPNVLLLCFRLGDGIRWASQPWQAIRQDDGSPPGLPAPLHSADGTNAAEEGHQPVHIYLVDCVTGIVCAHGAGTWPPKFVAALRAAIDRHLAGPQDDAAAGRELDALYQRWPKTADLVRNRADITCRGGKQS
jgi:hypothetical protein